MATIGIIGAGVVGGTHLHFFKEKHECVVYDPKKDDRQYVDSIDTVVRRVRGGVIFVCVPTPMKDDGSCDLSYVYDVFLELHQPLRYPEFGACPPPPVVVLKSTVPPGTTRKLSKLHPPLRIVYCPEFLTEWGRYKDFPNEQLLICGHDHEARKAVLGIYAAAVPEIRATFHSDYEIGECCKYFRNVALAVTVSLANEFAAICKHAGADYDLMRDLLLDDERIGRSHWRVPGPDGQPGFGGRCLPKDIRALVAWCLERNVLCDTMIGAIHTNCRVRPDSDEETT